MSGRRDIRETGQAMVEFALVAPVLFLTVLGLMTMGVTFGKQLDLKGATRDGARRAAVSIDQADPVSIARQTVRDQLGLTDGTLATINVTPAPPWNHGDLVTVDASIPHEYGFMGIGWSGTLRAESTIRIE